MKKGIFYSLLIFLLAITFLKLSSNSKAAFDNMPKVGLPYSIIEIGPDGSRKETKGISTGEDADTILSDLKIEKLENDRIQAFPELAMQIGSQITVNRAPVIFVKDGKRSVTYRSWQKTVGELFAERKIEIGKDDKVSFADDIELENNIQIVITRVAITTIVEKEAIKFTTVKKPNPNVEKGNKKILQAGKNGSKDKYYLVRREDGEEVSRSFIKSEVTLEPVDEIIEVGTKVILYGSGKATWYIETSEMIAAHNSLPRGTKVVVTNIVNGKSVVVTIKGGGIYHSDNVIIDLSTAAFCAIGELKSCDDNLYVLGKMNNIRVEKYYPES